MIDFAVGFILDRFENLANFSPIVFLSRFLSAIRMSQRGSSAKAVGFMVQLNHCEFVCAILDSNWVDTIGNWGSSSSHGGDSGSSLPHGVTTAVLIRFTENNAISNIHLYIFMRMKKI